MGSKDTTAYVPHSNNQESISLHSFSSVDNERQPTDVCHSNKDGVTTIEIVDNNVEKRSDHDNSNEKAEEDLSLDNLRNMTGLIKRKLNDKSSGPSQSDKSKYSFSSVTHVKTFQSTKEIRETIQGDISRTRSAIKKKKIIIVQQTIVTIVESVSNWLDKVEYRISTVKKIKTVNQKKEELKSIK